MYVWVLRNTKLDFSIRSLVFLVGNVKIFTKKKANFFPSPLETDALLVLRFCIENGQINTIKS